MAPYRSLDSRIQETPDFSYIDLDNFTPRDREGRRKYIRDLKVSKPIMLFRVCYGGSVGTLNFVWPVPEEDSNERVGENAKVVAEI